MQAWKGAFMAHKVLQLGKRSADAFCRMRMQLFAELGEMPDGADTFALRDKTKRYFLDHINKDLFSWGVFQNEELVAVGALCLFNRLPYWENLSGAEGYILNIYTSAQARNFGFANEILDQILVFSRQKGIKRLWLSSSEQGKGIYAKRGFVPIERDMVLFL